MGTISFDFEEWVLTINALSLRSYCRRFSPAQIARTSMSAYRRSPYPYTDARGNPQECALLDIPLFAVSQVMAEAEAPLP